MAVSRRQYTVSRRQYTAARRLVRQNGVCALRWLPKDVRECVETVHFSRLVDQLYCRVKAVELVGANPRIGKSFLTTPFGPRDFA